MATKVKNRISEVEANGSPDQWQVGDMVKLRLRFTGFTPLLQHNAKGMSVEDQKKGGLDKTEKVHLTGEAEARTGLYVTTDGKRYYHPAEAFRDAIIEAVVGTKIGKKSAPDLFMSGLLTTHDEAILVNPDTGKPYDVGEKNPPWKVDTRTVVVPSTGGRVPRSRPIWDKWACEVEFERDPFTLKPEIVLQAANIAGARVGVGQLRPKPKKGKNRGRGGRFGKFRAEIVK